MGFEKRLMMSNSKYFVKNEKFIILRLPLIFFLIFMVSACVKYPILNPESMTNIENGKTTGNDIEKWFGVPDLIIYDSEMEIPPDSLLSQYYMKDPEKKYPASISILDVKSLIENFIKQEREYILSDKQKAFIYFDIMCRLKLSGGRRRYVEVPTEAGYPIGVFIDEGKLKWKEEIYINEFAIFLNRDSNIVEDFVFRKEWEWEDFDTIDYKKMYRPFIPKKRNLFLTIQN